MRLAEIDTPEKGQPYGQRSKQALSSLIGGKAVTVDVETRDRYQRLVGRVYQGGVDVNREMVKIGAAWVYRDYLRDQSLLSIESEARDNKRGLWAMPESERIPPWEWRKIKRGTNIKPAVKENSISDKSVNCVVKRTCKQMSNCTEARFYLQQCGLTRLDRDKDGIPCESICR